MRLAIPCLAGPCLALAAVLLGACAGTSPAERAEICRVADWHEYGLNDGRLGVPAEDRADLFAACRELGDPADPAAYRAGRAEGLEAYCTAEQGYEVGRRGGRYREVCPPEAEIGFLQGYEQGRRDHARQYRASPRFGFGFGFGSYRPHHRWWFGQRHHWGFGRHHYW